MLRQFLVSLPALVCQPFQVVLWRNCKGEEGKEEVRISGKIMKGVNIGSKDRGKDIKVCIIEGMID